jgi:heme-degrading monooxygenase HmoA
VIDGVAMFKDVHAKRSSHSRRLFPRETQLNYASSLTEKPTGFIGSRLYRGLDGRTVVLVSQFESIKAQEEISQLPSFRGI